MRDTAQLFRALADETRLQMLWLLFNHRELCVCDIMMALGISQSKASRHLATLRHAKLVTDRKEGLWAYYSLRPAADPLTQQLLDCLRAGLAAREDAAALLTTLCDCVRGEADAAACTTKKAGCASARAASRTAGRSAS